MNNNIRTIGIKALSSSISQRSLLLAVRNNLQRSRAHINLVNALAALVLPPEPLVHISANHFPRRAYRVAHADALSLPVLAAKDVAALTRATAGLAAERHVVGQRSQLVGRLLAKVFAAEDFALDAS